MGGFNKSKGSSSSQQSSVGQASQSVWGPQALPLQNMFSQAANVAQGSRFFGQGDADQGLGMATQLAGGGGPFGQALQGYSQGGNPFAQAQIGQLGDAAGRFLQQSVLPGISGMFGQAGGLGGSRHALAMGQAAEGVGQSFMSGATDILANSANLGVQAAGMGSQLQLGGLAAMPGAYNLGLMGQGFGPLAMLSQILGDPTVLGQSWDRAQGTSRGRESSFGMNILTGGGGGS